jgi:hypothetical protein
MRWSDLAEGLNVRGPGRARVSRYAPSPSSAPAASLTSVRERARTGRSARPSVRARDSRGVHGRARRPGGSPARGRDPRASIAHARK